MTPSPRIVSVLRSGLAGGAVLVAIALLAPGCGADTRRGEGETSGTATGGATTQGQQGGGPTVTTTGKPPSSSVTDPARRAYIAKVDRICSQLDREHKGAREEVGKAGNEKEAATAYEGTIALWERQLSKIRAVPVPPGDQSSLRANLFDVIRRQLSIRREIRNALVAVDVPRLRRLRNELDNLTVALTGFARGYGFRVCGEGGD